MKSKVDCVRLSDQTVCVCVCVCAGHTARIRPKRREDQEKKIKEQGKQDSKREREINAKKDSQPF